MYYTNVSIYFTNCFLETATVDLPNLFLFYTIFLFFLLQVDTLIALDKMCVERDNKTHTA